MLIGFLTIVVVVACGWLLAHRGVLDERSQVTLGEVAFFVCTPALMVRTISEVDVGAAGRNLVASVLSLAACFVAYAVLARVLWRLPTGEVVIGSLSASYVNAGNLGIAIAAYVVGDVAVVVPTLLVQMLLVQPACLMVLDRIRAGESHPLALARRLVTNPLTVSAVVGAVLALTGWGLPDVVAHPLDVLGGGAIPLMLLSYGAALRLAPAPGRSGHRREVVAVTVLKLVVMPAVAWALGLVLGLEGDALLGVVMTAALPTAQNIFLHATRYRVGEGVAREAILVTTVLALPVSLLVALLLGGAP